MGVYIRGIGIISPQRTYDNSSFLEEITSHQGPFLKCVEPDYKSILPKDKLPRRLSRSLKIGVTAAGLCLEDANCDMPDAIITGTGLGMLADTEKFLTTMLENNEKFLNPTSFIQSTHNTIGAYIAVMLKCNKYNFTYVHGSLSFEGALLNSILKLEEEPGNKILLGGIDELTEQHYQIKAINHKYKNGPVNHLEMTSIDSDGAIPGEGAAFFLLTKDKSDKNYSKITGLETFYRPENIRETEERIKSFLSNHKVEMGMIDLVILGLNGDRKSDKIYNELRKGLFADTEQACFKHLCGEYPTSIAFGTWLATNIIHYQIIPDIIKLTGKNQTKNHIRYVLLYNHSLNLNHSVVLVSACDQ